MKSVKSRYGSLEELQLHTEKLDGAEPGYAPTEWLIRDQQHHRELLELANWWAIGRPKLVTEMVALAEQLGRGIRFEHLVDADTGARSFVISRDETRKEIRAAYREKRRHLRDLETQMLHKLINIRHELD